MKVLGCKGKKVEGGWKGVEVKGWKGRKIGRVEDGKVGRSEGGKVGRSEGGKVGRSKPKPHGSLYLPQFLPYTFLTKISGGDLWSPPTNKIYARKPVSPNLSESECAISPTALGLFLMKKQLQWNQCACLPSKKGLWTMAASRRSPLGMSALQALHLARPDLAYSAL